MHVDECIIIMIIILTGGHDVCKQSGRVHIQLRRCLSVHMWALILQCLFYTVNGSMARCFGHKIFCIKNIIVWCSDKIYQYVGCAVFNADLYNNDANISFMLHTTLLSWLMCTELLQGLWLALRPSTTYQLKLLKYL